LAEILVHGTGVIVKHARRRLNLISGVRDGLATAACLDLGNNIDLAADAIRDGPQHATTLERRQSRPGSLIERAASRCGSAVEVLGSRACNLGIGLAGDGADHRERVARRALNELPVDQELGLKLNHRSRSPDAPRTAS